MRVLRRVVVGMLLLAVLAVGAPWLLVQALSAQRIRSVADSPERDVALVLGAAMWGKDPSPYLQGRLDVAVRLYQAKKVKVIIVSGSRSTNYSEPDGMKAALIQAGVPAQVIVIDYRGVDTYASCVRAKEVFGVDRLTVVSQTYHLPRALATCRLVGVDAVGSGDDGRAEDAMMARYKWREVGANIKMVWDAISRRQHPMDDPSDAVAEALSYANR